MNDEWEMTVKVRLRNVMEGESVDVLRGIIADEGGPMQVICGWCDADDLEIVSLLPVQPKGDHKDWCPVNGTVEGNTLGDCSCGASVNEGER